MKKIGSTKIATIISLSAQGHSYREIGAMVGLDKNTVMTYARKNKDKIDAETAALRDDLLRDLNFSLRDELKYQIISLQKIRAQLNRVNLSKVSVRELLKLEDKRLFHINNLIGHKPMVIEKYIESDMKSGTGIRKETIVSHRGKGMGRNGKLS